MVKITQGIYMFYTNENILYIGSSTNIEKRIKDHLFFMDSPLYKNHNKPFYDFLKDNSFNYKILEMVPKESRLPQRERYFILKYKPLFNKDLPRTKKFCKYCNKELEISNRKIKEMERLKNVCYNCWESIECPIINKGNKYAYKETDNQLILAMRKQGKTIKEIAKATNVSERTVSRRLKEFQKRA